jgi:molybdopterin-guanine dinucleotide biosynthesis protein B
MKIIAFVGNSGSGKTRLMVRLVAELKKRGRAVAVIKHCGHGFDLGGNKKDSSQYLAAGANGVAVTSSRQWAVIRKSRQVPSYKAIARDSFRAADIILVEGGRKDKSLKKVEVMRRGVSDNVKTPARELAAVVANFPVACDVPVFSPDAVADVADWLEGGLR